MRWVLVAVVAGCLWTAARAAEGPERERAAEIQRAVAALGAAEFAAREAAERRLWQFGEEALPALADAAESDDPEVANRAFEMMEQMRWGVTQDTPEELKALLLRMRHAPDETREVVSAQLAARGIDGVLALVRISRLNSSNARWRGMLATHVQNSFYALGEKQRPRLIAEITRGCDERMYRILYECLTGPGQDRKHAADIFLDAARRNPRTPLAYRFAVQALVEARRGGEIPGLLAELERQEIEPEPRTLEMAIHALQGLGQYEAAIKYTTMALEKGATADLYEKRAEQHVGLEQWEKAIDDFGRCIGMAPENFRARTRRATIYMRLNQYAKAAEDWQRVAESKSEFAAHALKQLEACERHLRKRAAGD